MTAEHLPSWGIPFSAERKDARRAHLLLTTKHEGLAFRACEPGLVVNIALARRKSAADSRCVVCLGIEAKQQVRSAA
jgi:hypothetical protein